MTERRIRWSVFTKPWKMPLPELGKLVGGMGFDGIELPVRPGFQVEPANVSEGLPAAARVLADFGLKIESVAGPTDEATMAACADVGVPIIRIMVEIGEGGYLAAIVRKQKELAVSRRCWTSTESPDTACRITSGIASAMPWGCTTWLNPSIANMSPSSGMRRTMPCRVRIRRVRLTLSGITCAWSI